MPLFIAIAYVLVSWSDTKHTRVTKELQTQITNLKRELGEMKWKE
jgi:hypothetical protein